MKELIDRAHYWVKFSLYRWEIGSEIKMVYYDWWTIGRYDAGGDCFDTIGSDMSSSIVGSEFGDHQILEVGNIIENPHDAEEPSFYLGEFVEGN